MKQLSDTFIFFLRPFPSYVHLNTILNSSRQGTERVCVCVREREKSTVNSQPDWGLWFFCSANHQYGLRGYSLDLWSSHLGSP